jgi:23S rRNA pseudouridine1911/1915/1917 synthase
MSKVRVEDMDDGSRIDQFMVDELSKFSRGQVQKWIVEGDILLNNEVVKNNTRLKEGDVITYTIVEEDMSLHPIKMDLDIVYEDDDIIVINKPKGMVVHPTPTTITRPTLVHGLLAYTNHLSDINGELRPGIVHRLDKDTSGLMIVAKTNQAHEALAAMLKERLISREYLALVHHEFVHQNAIIDAPIGRDPRNRQKMAVTHINSKEARTKVALVEKLGDYSLLRCALESGRTHQIRVHLQYIKHPIVGDKTYSYKNTMDTDGQCLHAFRLAFKHPISGIEMEFEVEPPASFKEALETIRRQL